MNNKILTIIGLLFYTTSLSYLHGQTRQVLSSNGTSSIKNGIYLTQTIGQDASFTQKATAGQYFAQGFQQPLQKSSISVNEINPMVFPNPNDGAFTITDLDIEKVRDIQIYDTKGASLRLSYSLLEKGILCRIDEYASGIYLLNIVLENGQNKSVKIIKK